MTSIELRRGSVVALVLALFLAASGAGVARAGTADRSGYLDGRAGVGWTGNDCPQAPIPSDAASTSYSDTQVCQVSDAGGSATATTSISYREVVAPSGNDMTIDVTARFDGSVTPAGADILSAYGTSLYSAYMSVTQDRAYSLTGTIAYDPSSAPGGMVTASVSFVTSSFVQAGSTDASVQLAETGTLRAGTTYRLLVRAEGNAASNSTTSLLTSSAVATVRIQIGDLPDSDNDGLTDDVEATLGTDPTDADTDDDGYTDGVEVNDLQSDPLDPNSPDPPVLSVSDALGFEGSGGGSTPFVFTVGLSKAADQPVSVSYGTSTGTAGPDDFAPIGGALVFAPGEITKSVVVDVMADDEPELDESFQLSLFGPVGADISDAIGTGTILDDDCDNDFTDGDDVIIGTAGDDLLCGGAGNDTIDGLGGNDRIVGGLGADTLLGGTGNDTILGGEGDDVIEGGSGADDLAGEAGHDTLSGGPDDDLIDGGDGFDRLYGDAGNDVITTGAGDATILGFADMADGGRGNDQISGGAGDDQLVGGPGDDTIAGEGGNDWLYGDQGPLSKGGGSGSDTILGGDGNDVIDGGGRSDVIDGGAGTDQVNAGAGDDMVEACDGELDTIDGGRGSDGGAIDAIDTISLMETPLVCP